MAWGAVGTRMGPHTPCGTAGEGTGMRDAVLLRAAGCLGGMLSTSWKAPQNYRKDTRGGGENLTQGWRAPPDIPRWGQQRRSSLGHPTQGC